MKASSWYNAERVSRPGSVILQDWMASRRAGAVSPRAEVYPSSSGVAGSSLYDWMTSGIRSAGVAVTEQTAMSLAAVVGCVELIGATIASLPLHVYERTEGGGRNRIDTEFKWLFNESPYPSWTSANAWRHYSQSVGLQGAGFWIIHRRRTSNSVTGLEPIHPAIVNVERVSGGRNLYVIDHPERGRLVLEQEDVLHFAGLGYDGCRSLTPLRYWLRNAAGINLAADEFAASFFANGARPDFALTTPNATLNTEQVEALRTTWSQRHQGPRNAHLPAVLTGGLDIKQLTLNAEDAQLIATRNLQVTQICMIYGVPPHMIGHTEKSTSWGSGIEQMSIGFVRYTLRKHLDVLQQEINRKLWPRNSRVFAEFSVDALLEGDSSAQAAYFNRALGGPGAQGWMTVNEVRRLKNLPPIAGGDELIKAGITAEAKNATDDQTSSA